jgi:hypothetical protein
MAGYKGYTIETVSEDTFDSAMKPAKIKSHQVSTPDGKIVAVGLSTMEAAKAAVEHRCKLRQRGGLEAVG